MYAREDDAAPELEDEEADVLRGLEDVAFLVGEGNPKTGVDFLVFVLAALTIGEDWV